MKRKGVIALERGARPEPHEHTPDIEWLGKYWEMKAPEGKGKTLARNTLQTASKQSENIIIDLRRCRRDEKQMISNLRDYLNRSKSIKKLKVIRKTGELVDLR